MFSKWILGFRLCFNTLIWQKFRESNVFTNQITKNWFHEKTWDLLNLNILWIFGNHSVKNILRKQLKVSFITRLISRNFFQSSSTFYIRLSELFVIFCCLTEIEILEYDYGIDVHQFLPILTKIESLITWLMYSYEPQRAWIWAR